MRAQIGDVGRAACPLYPSGRVLIGRTPMAARAEAVPIEEGTEVVVVGGDRFSLVVRPLDKSIHIPALPQYGHIILSGKEEASLQAELHEANRREENEAHRRMFRQLMIIGTGCGLLIGIGLMSLEILRSGYSDQLLWIPLLSSAEWCCIIGLTFFMGMATENILFFISIPSALVGLAAGLWLWGPFAAITLSFVFGTLATLASLLLEVMRHPVT